MESLLVLCPKDYLLGGGVYCHPSDQNQEADLKIGRAIREVTKGKNVVILGDFNCAHIDHTKICSNHAIETNFLGIIMTVH